MKNRIIEIVELGKPQSIIQREGDPITELIHTHILIEELNEQCTIPSVSSSINTLLAKFDNGLELYLNNAVFANCIEHLLRGGDVYKILEQIVVMQSSQQKQLTDLIKSGTLRQEIIVSKERFDEIKDKGL